jgi:hypothetical protein
MEIKEPVIKQVQALEIKEIEALPPPVILGAPITQGLPFGFIPVIDMPCAETRERIASSTDLFNTDRKNNVILCDHASPSFNPPDYYPQGFVVQPPLPQLPSEPKELTAKDLTPKVPTPKIVLPPPCPPGDALAIGNLNASKTKRVKGYELQDGKCVTLYTELRPIPEIVGDQLPDIPVVLTTAGIALTATGTAVFAKPLGDLLLKAVKPTIKKVVKKASALLGKKKKVLSTFERRKAQKAARK